MESICICHSFEFIPIDKQPQDFVAALSPEHHAMLLAACAGVAAGFVDGRPHGSRTVLLGSATLPGLFLLRAVWPGAPEPQLRMICLRDGPRVLVARGFIQDGDRVPADEVALAEQAILRAQELGRERAAEKAR